MKVVWALSIDKGPRLDAFFITFKHVECSQVEFDEFYMNEVISRKMNSTFITSFLKKITPRRYITITPLVQ